MSGQIFMENGNGLLVTPTPSTIQALKELTLLDHPYI
jgi:hypothetical protein